MNFFGLLLQVASATTNSAVVNQGASSVKSVASKGNPTGTIFLLVAMFAVFYFLLIRPNQKREKQKRNEIASIKEGDRIITSGGIKGKVISVKEDSIVIESKDSKIEIVKFAVGRVIK